MKHSTTTKRPLVDQIESCISKLKDQFKSDNQHITHTTFQDEEDKYLFLKKKLDDIYNYGLLDDSLYDRIDNNIKEKIYGIDTQEPLADVIFLEERKQYKDIA